VEIDPLRIWYWISSFILAILLYFPVKKFIFVQRVRRTERKQNRELSEEERGEIARRVIPAAVFIALAFAFLFNKVLILKYYTPK
jgi:heme/copper-type cytochrome/quinol oxidase subunit 2